MRRLGITLSLLPAFLFLPWQASAQQSPPRPSGEPSFTFTLKKYGVKDGLAHRRVHAVVQDRDGFLWVATPAGLQRFDGYTFKLLTTRDGLQRDDVSDMWMDGAGLIWLVYNEVSLQFVTGIDILDPRSGTVRTFEEHFGEGAPVRANVLASWVNYTPDSTLLLSAMGRIIRYHHRHGFSSAPTMGDEYLGPLLREPDGRTLCLAYRKDGDIDRLVYTDAQGNDAEEIAAYPVCIPLNGSLRSMEEYLHAGGDAAFNGYYCCYQPGPGAPDGELWIPRGGKPVVLRTSGAVRSPWSLLRRDLGDGLWLVHTTVRRMRAGDDPMKAEVLFDLATASPEIGFSLQNTFRDARGNLWLCAEFGLYRLEIRPSGFQRMLWSPEIPNGFGKRVRGMAITQDASFPGGHRLLVNTESDGFFALDAREGSVLAKDTSSLLRYAMAVDADGSIWRNEEDTVRHVRADGVTPIGKALRFPHAAWSLLPNNGALLGGTTNGITRMDMGTGEVQEPSGPADPSLVDALRSALVVHIGRDREDGLWACASNGLYRINEEGVPLERWWNGGDEAHRLPTLEFRHFMQDGAGVFWIATGGSGLLRWDRKTGTVRAVTRSEGMPSNTLHAVYADAQGNIWSTTDDGLVRYAPETGRITAYTTADGIAHNEFNRLAHTRGPDGRLYFGGLNGITVVDPAALIEPKGRAEAPLLFTGAQLFSGNEDRIVDRSPDARNGTGIVIRPGDRFLNIAFALLSFEDPKSILYGWRIDGVDADWNYQHEPDLRITTLPYGDHRLRIKAQGSDGIWGAEELVLPIHVVRPFYLRSWFIALCVLAAVALVYAVFRYRLAQAKKVYAMRDRIAADLHDEVGSSLSNIAMFGELMRERAAEQTPQLRRMIERITSNSAKALESMNDIVWNVNTRFEGTEHLIARMRAFAAQAAEARGFELKFTVDESMKGVKLDMERRKNVYLIFKEAVNNAAKYSGCTELSVQLGPWGKGARLVVADNGKGFEQGQVDPSGGGHGLSGMARRAELIGAWLNVVTNPGEGTSITLEIDAGTTLSRTLGMRRTGNASSFAP